MAGFWIVLLQIQIKILPMRDLTESLFLGRDILYARFVWIIRVQNWETIEFESGSVFPDLSYCESGYQYE